jgi:hypothetical protein
VPIWKVFFYWTLAAVIAMALKVAWESGAFADPGLRIYAGAVVAVTISGFYWLVRTSLRQVYEDAPPKPMRRGPGILRAAVLFIVLTAILIHLIVRIVHEGPLSFGIAQSIRYAGPQFGAEGVFFIAVFTAIVGYELLDRVREYRRERKRSRNLTTL